MSNLKSIKKDTACPLEIILESLCTKPTREEANYNELVYDHSLQFRDSGPIRNLTFICLGS